MIARKNQQETAKQNLIDLNDLVFLVARRAHVPDRAMVERRGLTRWIKKMYSVEWQGGIGETP